MTSSELRQKFLDFFESKGHKVIPSASLVPENDPSVLFTTAGMQQFKPFYAEPDKAPYASAVSVQKCLRTSDIEEVGDDTHLTFFEMLGNFSFGYPEKKGSYFKKEAISFGWEFLTEVLKVDKSRIYATYFKGENGIPEDRESLELLKKIDDLKKIEPQGFEDNFWSLGTEGSPGGPTVEFYIDGIEIWNLVFNEYSLNKGKYEPSKHKGVDTGMGLERLLTTLNGHNDVYETDLFEKEIKIIEKITDTEYVSSKREIRRIVDHKRAINELITEGIRPGKNKKEYVLRTLSRVTFIIINMIMDKRSDSIPQLNTKEEFRNVIKELFFKDWGKVISDIYNNTPSPTQEIVNQEYKNYLNLEKSGLTYFSKYWGEEIITGQIIFKGKDTFGLNKEGILDLWNVANKKISPKWEKEYESASEKHRQVSRASAGMFKGGLADNSEEVTKYHTATHLLNAALRQVLGEYVEQRGSNITADRMRFDFSHEEKMTDEEKEKVEDLVNEQIKAKLTVTKEEMTVEEAKKSGAVGVFGEKYGEKVSVYTIGDFSKEICGGPHVKSTGELGVFKIKKEESSSKGVRRIKAVLE